MESLQWKRRSVNRAIRWHPVSGGAELEADTRDVAMVLRDRGLEKATPVVSPVAKRPKAEVLLLVRILCTQDATLHSSVTMRVDNLSLGVQICCLLQVLWHEG